MLFTWDTTNLCIVFKEWRVTGTLSLVWSLLGVVVLTAGYELVRELSRRYEAKSAVTRGSDGSSEFLNPSFPSVGVLRGCLRCPLSACEWGKRLSRDTWLHCSWENSCWVATFFAEKRSRLWRVELIAFARTIVEAESEERQDHQSLAVCRAGLLLVFHHVSIAKSLLVV